MGTINIALQPDIHVYGSIRQSIIKMISPENKNIPACKMCFIPAISRRNENLCIHTKSCSDSYTLTWCSDFRFLGAVALIHRRTLKLQVIMP